MNLRPFFRDISVPLALTVLGVLFLASCNEEYQFSHGNIQGTITDATTGEKIKLCNVVVSDSAGSIVDRQTTNDSGEYRTKDLEDGRYTVDFEKEGYYTGASRTVQVTAEEHTICDVTLSRIPAKITADVEELDFGDNESLTTLSFKIVNPYHEALDWIVEYKCDWIVSISPVNDNLAHGKTASIVVRIDREKLQGGENKTNLVVKSLNGQGSVNVVVKAVGAYREAPVLNVTGVTGIDKTVATLAGEIVNPGVPAYTRRGFTCSLTSKDDKATELSAEVNDQATFTCSISGLTPGKKYYVRAYAVSSYAGKVWSANEISFTTVESYPQVRTDPVTGLDLVNGRCTLNGYVIQTGNPVYSEKGFCVSSSGDPTIDNSKYAVSDTGSGAFSYLLAGLEKNKTYRYRAYAIQNGRVTYGDVASFNTMQEKTSVTTVSASGITMNSATLNGSILKVGSPAYSERGFCYSTYYSPDISSEKVVVSGSGTGDYSRTINNLEYGTRYYYRAYVIQNSSPVYGEILYFETSYTQAAVSTTDVTNVGYHSMTFNGRVTERGAPTISERGFCYSTSNIPTMNDLHVKATGTSLGEFSVVVSDLEDDSNYYVRAYVIQDGTVIYGAVKSARTPLEPVLVAYPADIIDYNGTTQTYKATFRAAFVDGDPCVTDAGFVISETGTPSVGNSQKFGISEITEKETDVYIFYTNIENLSFWRTYYYRAFVRTSLGYIYSETHRVNYP